MEKQRFESILNKVNGITIMANEIKELNSSDDFYLAISGESKILGGAKITSSGWSSYSTKVYLLGNNEKAKICLKYAACQDKSLYAQNCADEVIKLKKAIDKDEKIVYNECVPKRYTMGGDKIENNTGG